MEPRAAIDDPDVLLLQEELARALDFTLNTSFATRQRLLARLTDEYDPNDKDEPCRTTRTNHDEHHGACAAFGVVSTAAVRGSRPGGETTSAGRLAEGCG
jgi:hypothetical protein